jgi:hypothetical protein
MSIYLFLENKARQTKSRAMRCAVSQRPFMGEACVRSHAKLRLICGVQIGTGADFALSIFVFRSQKLSIRQMFHTYSFTYNRRYLILANNSVFKQKQNTFSNLCNKFSDVQDEWIFLEEG